MPFTVDYAVVKGVMKMPSGHHHDGGALTHLAPIKCHGPHHGMPIHCPTPHHGPIHVPTHGPIHHHPIDCKSHFWDPLTGHGHPVIGGIGPTPHLPAVVSHPTMVPVAVAKTASGHGHTTGHSSGHSGGGHSQTGHQVDFSGHGQIERTHSGQIGIGGGRSVTGHVTTECRVDVGAHFHYK